MYQWLASLQDSDGNLVLVLSILLDMLSIIIIIVMQSHRKENEAGCQ
jgi:hypothetical protein